MTDINNLVIVGRLTRASKHKNTEGEYYYGK